MNRKYHLYEPLRNRSRLWLQLFPYPSQRKQKHLTVCQTWKPSIYLERWGDSSLCNKKFSTQRRGWTFSPPLSDSALEPSSQNSHQRRSAASWSCGWCGAACAWHSHKHKPLALSDCTWQTHKHTLSAQNGPFWLTGIGQSTVQKCPHSAV